jgi:hypothetical protein
MSKGAGRIKARRAAASPRQKGNSPGVIRGRDRCQIVEKLLKFGPVDKFFLRDSCRNLWLGRQFIGSRH